MKAEKYQKLKVKPEIVYRISECGGCGLQQQTQSRPDMQSTTLAFAALNVNCIFINVMMTLYSINNFLFRFLYQIPSVNIA